MLKVALVEDSPVIRQRFQAMLDRIDDVTVVGVAEDVAGAKSLVEEARPDVLVLDVALRDGERGMTVLKHVRAMHPEVEVITMSNFSWHAMKQGFIEAGARAYFDKATEFAAARDWIERRSRRSQALGSGGDPPIEHQRLSSIGSLAVEAEREP